jgi:hypothetical protein
LRAPTWNAVPIRFAEFSEPEQQLIMQKFATERKVMEAPRLIAVKARDMLRHYVRSILPGHCKAQVVAVSQEAVVTYQKKTLRGPGRPGKCRRGHRSDLAGTFRRGTPASQ